MNDHIAAAILNQSEQQVTILKEIKELLKQIADSLENNPLKSVINSAGKKKKLLND